VVEGEDIVEVVMGDDVEAEAASEAETASDVFKAFSTSACPGPGEDPPNRAEISSWPSLLTPMTPPPETPSSLISVVLTMPPPEVVSMMDPDLSEGSPEGFRSMLSRVGLVWLSEGLDTPSPTCPMSGFMSAWPPSGFTSCFMFSDLIGSIG